VYFCIDFFAVVWYNTIAPILQDKTRQETLFFALHHVVCIIGLVHSAVTKRDGGFILVALLFAEASNPIRRVSSILSRIDAGGQGKDDPTPILRHFFISGMPRFLRPTQHFVFGSFILSRFACLQLTVSMFSSNLSGVTFCCAWSLIALSALAMLRLFVSFV
jgi:hypothetical protein